MAQIMSETNIPCQTAVTIGNFDGVHTGHRKLIERLRTVSEETGLKTCVLTFSPHPRQFFNCTDFPLITTNAEKSLILDRLGVDYNVIAEFDKHFAELSPVEFFENVLVKALNCKHLAVGESFLFGGGRRGDLGFLRSLCVAHGISLEIVKPVFSGGNIISSGKIRNLLSEGDVSGANVLLGEPYFIYGEIVRGKSVGRTLGFPTINQLIPQNKLTPPDGVYFTKTLINGVLCNGVTNVGVRPTFGVSDRQAETFLFGFGGDAYGTSASVSFLQKRRNEFKFENVQKLREAVSLDKQAAEAFFTEEKI